MADNNKSSERPFLDNSDFTYRLQDIASRYWPAALAATLGSGLIGGGLAWKTKPLNETPAQRRKRILKAALLPMLGVGAGSAALMGAGAALNMTSLGHNLNTPEGRRKRLAEINRERRSLLYSDAVNYGVTAGAGVAGGIAGMGIPAAASKAMNASKSKPDATTTRLYTKPRKGLAANRIARTRVGAARKLRRIKFLSDILEWFMPRKAPITTGVATGAGSVYVANKFHPDRTGDYNDLNQQEAEIRNMQ